MVALKYEYSIRIVTVPLTAINGRSGDSVTDLNSCASIGVCLSNPNPQP